MRRIQAPMSALLLAVALAACGRDPAPDADAFMAPLDAGSGAIEWRGSLPCADCEAIDTRLVLERFGGEQRYELVEVYVSVDGSVSFEEAGRWRIHQSLLSLEPDTGGLRRYGLVHGGALQVRDLGGRAFPGREGDYLQPVGHRP